MSFVSKRASVLLTGRQQAVFAEIRDPATRWGQLVRNRSGQFRLDDDSAVLGALLDISLEQIETELLDAGYASLAASYEDLAEHDHLAALRRRGRRHHDDRGPQHPDAAAAGRQAERPSGPGPTVGAPARPAPGRGPADPGTDRQPDRSGPGQPDAERTGAERPATEQPVPHRPPLAPMPGQRPVTSPGGPPAGPAPHGPQASTGGGGTDEVDAGEAGERPAAREGARSELPYRRSVGLQSPAAPASGNRWPR